MATNFLNFCITGSAIDVAFVVGASLCWDWAAGRIYTWSVGSGHFMAWAVDFWGFSISSFPLPSSANIREVSSFFSHGQTAAPLSEDSKFSPSGCCRQGSSTMVSVKNPHSGFSSSR